MQFGYATEEFEVPLPNVIAVLTVGNGGKFGSLSS